MPCTVGGGGGNMDYMKNNTLKCRKCGADWEQRKPTKPVKCPRCWSPNWDRRAK